MSNCCSSESTTEKDTGDSCCSTPAPRKANCPGCQHESQPVEHLTLMHQLKAPLNQQLTEGTFYFCDDNSCDVVYFNSDDMSYRLTDLRQEVGQKSSASDRMLCYCFDIRSDRVTSEIAQHGHSPSKEFVVKMTKNKQCACDIRNPSGRCCLKDFPK